MGRHAGWIAASSALANENRKKPPHIILFPEIIFNEKKFLDTVQSTIKKYGFCVVVASEGTKNKKGSSWLKVVLRMPLVMHNLAV